MGSNIPGYTARFAKLGSSWSPGIVGAGPKESQGRLPETALPEGAKDADGVGRRLLGEVLRHDDGRGRRHRALAEPRERRVHEPPTVRRIEKDHLEALGLS